MENASVKAMIAGFLFGAWPLVMNKGGLRGNLASLVIGIVTVCWVFPFAVLGGSFPLPTGTKWGYVILASMLGSLGLVVFTSVLEKAPLEKAGSLVTLTVIVQITVASLYSLTKAAQLGQGISSQKVLGFFFAALAAYLLR